MVNIEIKGIKEFMNKLEKFESQVPFATARSLTQLAKEVKNAEVEEMGHVFDRPTPYTLGSLGVHGATKQRLVAEVLLKTSTTKGTRAEKYIGPQIVGGERSLKRFESALQRIGILPRGLYVVPGSGADLDAYGNISRGQIVQILSFFRAFGEQGYSANMTTKGRAKLMRGSKRKGRMGFAYFVSHGKGRTAHLLAGIYKRVPFSRGSAIKPIFMFVRKPTYKKRWPFFDIAKKITDRRSKAIFDEMFAEAIRTAKL